MNITFFLLTVFFILCSIRRVYSQQLFSMRLLNTSVNANWVNGIIPQTDGTKILGKIHYGNSHNFFGTKFTSSWDVEWSNIFSISGINQLPQDHIDTCDGGSVSLGNSGLKSLAMKIDSSGKVQWVTSLGRQTGSQVFARCLTRYNCDEVVVFSYDTVLFMAHLDVLNITDGSRTWKNLSMGSNTGISEEIYKAINCTKCGVSGSIYFTGTEQSDFGRNFVLGKLTIPSSVTFTDEKPKIEFVYRYGITGDQDSKALHELSSDGSVVIFGEFDTGLATSAIRINPSLEPPNNIIWIRRISEMKKAEAITETPDGTGLVFCGRGPAPAEYVTIVLLSVEDGSLIWAREITERSYGSLGIDVCYSITQMMDGETVMFGGGMDHNGDTEGEGNFPFFTSVAFSGNTSLNTSHHHFCGSENADSITSTEYDATINDRIFWSNISSLLDLVEYPSPDSVEVVDMTKQNESYYDMNCWGCFGILNDETLSFSSSSSSSSSSDFAKKYVCSGSGNCTSLDTCECFDSNNKDSQCRDFTCNNGILWNISRTSSETDFLCGGHGDCVAQDICSCHDNYTIGDKFDECAVWECFGVLNTKQRDVCNGHGECIDYNNCSCFGDGVYTGFDCGFYQCFGVNVKKVDEVCGRHGFCVDENLCICLSGYYTNDTSQIGGVCSEWSCNSISHNDNSDLICSGGRGECVSPNLCSCRDEYEGKDCESWSCGYDFKYVDLTCSGNGICFAPKRCQCKWGYSGKLCDENLLYISLMMPLLILAGLGLTSVIGCVFLCFCGFVCCTCCIGVGCGLFGFFSLLLVVFQQKIGITRFKKLENFDLLLKEQEMEKDSSVAHLRIKRKLFEIPFDEIKTERIIGEGGSQSIVFEAQWRGKICAFKCFKTRTVCSTQEKFDEFEKEVEIMSSLSHPNVIQFYGCTMNPPRVGIVMEFASNGELGDFLKEYRKKKKKKHTPVYDGDDDDVLLYNFYPIYEKLRWFQEIVAVLCYLHSRDIIHRDLKCENILVDELEHCKLMDFGLSKIVDRMSAAKTKRVGTNVYMAPELLNTGSYDGKCDVFSFAILMYTVITENFEPYGKQVFNIEYRVASDPSFRPSIKEVEHVLQKWEEKRSSEDDDDGSYSWIVDMIKKCWDHDAHVRYTFEEISEIVEKKHEEDKLFGYDNIIIQSSTVDGEEDDDDDNLGVKIVKDNRDDEKLNEKERKRREEVEKKFFDDQDDDDDDYNDVGLVGQLRDRIGELEKENLKLLGIVEELRKK